MATGIYLGNNSKAANVKGGYIGVNGVARKIKKGYIGVNGVARLFYQDAPPLPDELYLIQDGVAVNTDIFGGFEDIGSNNAPTILYRNKNTINLPEYKTLHIRYTATPGILINKYWSFKVYFYANFESASTASFANKTIATTKVSTVTDFSVPAPSSFVMELRIDNQRGDGKYRRVDFNADNLRFRVASDSSYSGSTMIDLRIYDVWLSKS